MKWFSNLRMNRKFLFAFLVLILLLVAVGFMGIRSTFRTQQNVDDFALVQLPCIDYLVQADRDLQQLLVAERSMIFANAGAPEFQQLVGDYEENLQQSRDRFNKYKELVNSVDSEEINAIIPEYENARSEWEAVSKQIVDGRKADTREGRRLAIDLSLRQANEKFEAMRDYLDKLQNIHEKQTAESHSISRSRYNYMFIVIVFLTTVAILISLLVWMVLNKTITRPVVQMVDRARDLVEGESDLTRRIDIETKDELGELSNWFNRFIQRIQDLMAQAKENSAELAGASDEVANGSESLAVQTNQQAASVTETSTTVEEFTAILRQNSENSDDTNATLTAFNKEIQARKELIENVTATMMEINESSKKIDAIVNVINDISFQTNLLALNAAVEAARAGEAGRGFAVVAAEVRNLAQKTAESSKSIREIVSQNVENTNRGTELVKETQEFFETILEVLSDISVKVQGITQGSKEQATGVEQINQTIDQLEGVINQNAQLVDRFADASKKMKTSSYNLKGLVEQFRTEDGETISRQAPAPKKPGKPAKPEKKKKEKPGKKPELKQSPPPPKPDKSGKGGEDPDFFAEDEDSFEEF